MTFFNERVTCDKLGYKKFPSFSSLSQKKKRKERNFKKCAKQVGNALETSGAFWRNNQIMTAYCIKVYFYKMNKKL